MPEQARSSDTASPRNGSARQGNFDSVNGTVEVAPVPDREVRGRPAIPPMSTAPLPVLVLGSGLTGIGVIRSLGRAGHEIYSIFAPHESATRSRWCRPIPRSWNADTSPAELAVFLAQLPLPRAVLIPCSDDWTKAVADLPESLRERFPASISTAPVIHTMTDKWRFGNAPMPGRTPAQDCFTTFPRRDGGVARRQL